LFGIYTERLNGNYLLNLWHLLLESLLDTHSECHIRHGTAAARSDKPHLDDAFSLVYIHKLDIASVIL
jgi:hypothetical protein